MDPHAINPRYKYAKLFSTDDGQHKAAVTSYLEEAQYALYHVAYPFWDTDKPANIIKGSTPVYTDQSIRGISKFDCGVPLKDFYVPHASGIADSLKEHFGEGISVRFDEKQGLLYIGNETDVLHPDKAIERIKSSGPAFQKIVQTYTNPSAKAQQTVTDDQPKAGSAASQMNTASGAGKARPKISQIKQVRDATKYVCQNRDPDRFDDAWKYGVSKFGAFATNFQAYFDVANTSVHGTMMFKLRRLRERINGMAAADHLLRIDKQGSKDLKEFGVCMTDERPYEMLKRLHGELIGAKESKEFLGAVLQDMKAKGYLKKDQHEQFVELINKDAGQLVATACRQGRILSQQGATKIKPDTLEKT